MDKTSPLFKDFSLAPVQIIPFVGELRDMSLAKMAFIYSYGRHLQCNSVDLTSVRVCAIGELLAPSFSSKLSMSEAQARRKLVEVVRCLIRSVELKKVSNLDSVKWKEACGKGGFLEKLVAKPVDEENYWPSTIPIERNAFIDKQGRNHLTPELAMSILALITINSKQHVRDEVLNLLLTMHLALLNNAEIPNVIAQRIKSIEKEVQIKVDLKCDDVQVVRKTYISDLNDRVARSIFIFWDSWLDKRMRVFLQPEVDLPLNRLNSIYDIKNAFLTFPDFPWENLALDSVYLMELKNVVKAMELVSTNPYYCYKKDLGIVNPLNFKNVSLLAKSLLNGRSNGKKITINEMISDEIKELISDYLKGKDIKPYLEISTEEIKEVVKQIKHLTGSMTDSNPEMKPYKCTMTDVKEKLESLMKQGSSFKYKFKFPE